MAELPLRDGTTDHLSNREFMPTAGEFENALKVKVLGVKELAGPSGKALLKASPYVTVTLESSAEAGKTKTAKDGGHTVGFGKVMSFAFKGRKFQESLIVEVWDGANPKKPVLVGKTTVDCAQSPNLGPAWPVGGWMPNDPVNLWYAIDIDGEKAKKRKQRSIEKRKKRLEKLKKSEEAREAKRLATTDHGTQVNDEQATEDLALAGAGEEDGDDDDPDDHGHGEIRLAYFYTGPTTDRRIRDRDENTERKAEADILARAARLSKQVKDYQRAVDMYDLVLGTYPEADPEFLGFKTVLNAIKSLLDKMAEEKAAIMIQASARRKRDAAKVAAIKNAKRREAQEQLEIANGTRAPDVDISKSPRAEVPGGESWQLKIKALLDSKVWQGLTMFNTMYALFATDIAMCWLSKTWDYPIAWVTFFVFLYFLFELTGNIVAERDYGALPGYLKYNFFFVLDFVGTVSLIPEFLIVFGVAETGVPDQVILARVARAARIGARLSRVTKLFRFQDGGNSMTDTFGKLGVELPAEDADDGDISGEIAAQVAEGISKNVIALVITLLVFVPIFDTSMPVGGLKQTKLDMLKMLQGIKDVDANVSFELGASPRYTEALDRFRSFQGDEIVYFTWDRDVYYAKNMLQSTEGTFSEEFGSADAAIFDSAREVTCNVVQCIMDLATIKKLRITELRMYGDTEDMNREDYEFAGMEFWINYKSSMEDDAFMNICYMLFIMLIFAVSSLVFMLDLNRLVIEPTSNVSRGVKIAVDRLMEMGGDNDPAGDAAYVEKSVLKIVNLLQISFGKAGTKIIQRSMQTASDQIEPLVPGRVVTGYYGFSDVEGFTALTEALKEDIIIFVNEMAKICHTQCTLSGGHPNKNVGDAFLNVWINEDPANELLACYRRVIQGIRDSETLNELAARKEIHVRFPAKQQKFGRFFPAMGCGISFGKSVEGAVGCVSARVARLHPVAILIAAC